MKGEFAIDGFIRYADVFLIDPDGDGYCRCPHIYLERSPDKSFYWTTRDNLSVGHTDFELDEGWKKIEFFPKKFSKAKPKLKIHKAKLQLDADSLQRFLKYEDAAASLFAFDDRYDFLAAREVIQLASTPGTDEHFLRITHVAKTRYGDYLQDSDDQFAVQQLSRRQLGRDVEEDEQVTVRGNRTRLSTSMGALVRVAPIARR